MKINENDNNISKSIANVTEIYEYLNITKTFYFTECYDKKSTPMLD